MVGHIADAVRVVGLLLPGHEDPDGVGGDAGDAVGGHEHDAGAEHHAAAEELQPGRDDDHLDQPGEGLGGGGKAGRVLLPPPDYPGAFRVKFGESKKSNSASYNIFSFSVCDHTSVHIECCPDD